MFKWTKIEPRCGSLPIQLLIISIMFGPPVEERMLHGSPPILLRFPIHRWCVQAAEGEPNYSESIRDGVVKA
jgi:hypothetical protein